MVKIASVQICSSDNIEENLNKINAFIKKASLEKAKMVVLPEDFSFIGKKEEDKIKKAEIINNGHTQAFLSKIAKENDIWLLAGSIPILPKKNDAKIFNASILYDNRGNVKATYNKIHLFDVKIQGGAVSYNESKVVYGGNEVICVDSPFGKLGLSICYDLRFPELYRILVEKGAQILFVPAAFTKFTGSAHWEILLRARAIENFCYVVSSNQTGTHVNDKSSYGHSMVINPWGEKIAQLDEEEGVLIADINLDEIKKYRESIPALENRKFYYNN